MRFAGTSKGIESRLVPREGYPLDTIEITGLRRSRSAPSAIGHNVNAPASGGGFGRHGKEVAAPGTARRGDRLWRLCLVPGCLGGAEAGAFPTVLLEVNAYPGITTKMLAKKADKVLICFEEARALVGGGAIRSC